MSAGAVLCVGVAGGMVLRNRAGAANGPQNSG
jgi:hypothetical protein